MLKRHFQPNANKSLNFGEQKFHATAYKLLKAPVGAYAHVPV